MVQTTRELLDKTDEFMKKAKAELSVEDLLDMDQNTREALKLAFEIYSDSRKLAIEQAEIIERLDFTTQELLRINKKLLENSRDL